jgi:hypothetical protein
MSFLGWVMVGMLAGHVRFEKAACEDVIPCSVLLLSPTTLYFTANGASLHLRANRATDWGPQNIAKVV